MSNFEGIIKQIAPPGYVGARLRQGLGPVANNVEWKKYDWDNFDRDQQFGLYGKATIHAQDIANFQEGKSSEVDFLSMLKNGADSCIDQMSADLKTRITEFCQKHGCEKVVVRCCSVDHIMGATRGEVDVFYKDNDSIEVTLMTYLVLEVAK